MKRGLTKSQAHELLRAASVLPPATRDQFFVAVDSRLIGIRRQLTDDDVAGAIVSVLSTFNVTTSHDLMCNSTEGTQAMATQNYEVFDRYGRRVDRDGSEQLRDGDRLRVPLHMRDGVSSMQRSVMADKAARRFGLADGSSLHRNGPRYCIDEAARARVEQARAEWIAEMCDAWRTPAVDAGEFRGAREGDQCTVREGGHDEGSPGHLRMVNGRLTCAPDRRRQDAVPRTMTMDEAQRIKDEAWLESVKDLESAWKGSAR